MGRGLEIVFIETLQLLVKREISGGKEKSSYLVKWISIVLVY